MSAMQTLFNILKEGFVRVQKDKKVFSSSGMPGIGSDNIHRSISPFSPAKETIHDKRARLFGEWEAERDPLKHARPRQESREDRASFPRPPVETAGREQELVRDARADAFCEAVEVLAKGKIEKRQ